MNTGQSKLVSVILPLHNNELYIRKAVESILDQTYRNIELLILISAATSKESEDIVHSFTDKRVRLIYRQPFDNLPKALNLGLDEAKGEYIARMDSDDFSLSCRLETQVRYMESYPHVGLCGTWYKTFGYGKPFINRLYTDSDDIKANLLFYTSFAHPSVMFRRQLLEKFRLRYNESLSWSEDYDLWSRCADCFQLANVGKVLLRYRIHKKNASNVFRQETKDAANDVRMRILAKIGITPTKEELRLHNSFFPEQTETIALFLEREEQWLCKLIETNDKSSQINRISLQNIIFERWRVICGMNANNGLIVWRKFKNSALTINHKAVWPKTQIQELKIFFKCLLRKR